MLIIFKKEILTFMHTPTLYVCLALFVFLANYLHFVEGKFFLRDTASLASTFFHWHPWLYTFFAPAICMRLWSEEYRQKTMELLVTMGFRPWQIVCGKFLASWCVLLVALLFTSPLIYTLYKLGPPDIGVVLSGYIGSALLAAAFLGVAISAASLTRNQFISYILGACVCALIAMLGSEASMNTLIRVFPAMSSLTDSISSLSMFSHYKLFQRGIISANGVLYFVSTAMLGLYLAHFSISHSKR